VTQLVAATGALASDGSSAPVTEWPTRLGLTALVLLGLALVGWAMWRGWQGRARRQSGLAAPPQVPATFSADLVPPCEGSYLATTTAGEWLDRVVAHGLGAPSAAWLSVGRAGVLLEREGAPDVFVPALELRAVRADRGIAGAVYEAGGVLVLTWSLGGDLVDTGFRARHLEDHVAVAKAVSGLLDPHGAGPAAAVPSEGDPL
jgi:hypothetical protein